MADEKILNSEILSDEQLDGVAGGTDHQTSSDMNYLYKRYNVLWPQNWDRAVDKLGAIYWEAGLRLDTSANHDNRYYQRTPYGERSINQYDARAILTAELERDPYRFAKFVR